MPVAVGAFVLGTGATAGASMIVGSVIIGAATGALVSAVQGGDILKGALMGGLVGAVSGGIGANMMGPASKVVVGAGGAAAEGGSAVAKSAVIEGVNDGAFSNVPGSMVSNTGNTAVNAVANTSSSKGLLSMFTNTAADGATTLNAGGEAALKGLVGMAQSGMNDNEDEAAKLANKKWEDQYIPERDRRRLVISTPAPVNYLDEFNQNMLNLTNFASNQTVKAVKAPTVQAIPEPTV